MKKMICPQCKEQGKTSTVVSLGASTTLVSYSPYWDTDGSYHDHDYNTTTHRYKCSEGHFWSEKSYGECPNPECDWKGGP